MFIAINRQSCHHWSVTLNGKARRRCPLIEKFVINRLDQLKAMAEPIRVRMVESLVSKERSMADLAKRLGEPISKLYHHADVLLEAGLIRVTRREKRRGAEERFLRAIALDYVVDDALFDFGQPDDPTPEALIEVTTGLLRGIGEEFAAAARNGSVDPKRKGRRCFVEAQTLQLSEADFADLFDRLDQWIQEAKARSGPRKAVSYRLGTVFFPTSPPRGKAKS